MSKKINMKTKLSNKQKHTLEYWQVATTEIETTCLSVLNLLYQNDDHDNYLKYQRQFHNFKNIRSVLFNIVLKTIESDNLLLMEGVVIDAIRQLMNMITLTPPLHQSSTNKIETKKSASVSGIYNKIALFIIDCMSKLKTKLSEIDDYLSKIPAKKLKYEIEALNVAKTLDNFAKKLNFLLEITLKGRETRNEEVAKDVFQSIELIMNYIKGISLAQCDKRVNLRMHRPLTRLATSTSMSGGLNDEIVRRKRNILTLVKENKHQKSIRLNNEPDTSCSIEKILNDESSRFREKLKAIKQRVKCSTKKLTSQDDSIPYGWIHPTEEQIEEYISKIGGCPTSTFQSNEPINARQRFTLEELVNKFPVDTQHLRFPPNPSDATIFKPQSENTVSFNTVNRVDEDLLEGLLWQWHEISDSESTVSFRFQFEMSDSHRRERWFRGFRRLLELDPSTRNLLQKEIQLVKKSQSYVEKCKQSGSGKSE